MNKNVKKFIELVTNNPDLRVIPLIDSEIVQDDDHDRWTGRIGDSTMKLMHSKDEEFYFLEDIDELADDLEQDLSWEPIYKDMEDEERLKVATDIVKNEYKWEKVIIVDIDLP